MSQDTHIQAVEKLIGPLLQDDIFLVSIKIKPTNNIKIYLDADGGLGIEKCIRINRALYRIMEEMGMYPDGDFSLEVSSPGVDEPLKLLRQYKKNAGRNVEVILNDDSRKEGVLLTFLVWPYVTLSDTREAYLPLETQVLKVSIFSPTF